MVALAAAENPGFVRWWMRRGCKRDRPSYTIDTLIALSQGAAGCTPVCF